MADNDCPKCDLLIVRVEKLEDEKNRIIRDIKHLSDRSKKNEYAWTKLSGDIVKLTVKIDSSEKNHSEAVKHLINVVEDFKHTLIGKDGNGEGIIPKMQKEQVERDKQNIKTTLRQNWIWGILVFIGTVSGGVIIKDLVSLTTGG